jgi:hypothetical protein
VLLTPNFRDGDEIEATITRAGSAVVASVLSKEQAAANGAAATVSVREPSESCAVPQRQRMQSIRQLQIALATAVRRPTDADDRPLGR